MQKERIIMHVDLDAFFAACEELREERAGELLSFVLPHRGHARIISFFFSIQIFESN